ncbi:MAG TPA: hypothetical protein VK788_21090 [Terriglobales bacterium]|nr:hypothetical protein [Terriglobales bacterium]
MRKAYSPKATSLYHPANKTEKMCAISFVRNEPKQIRRNKHESDAVWKSMEDSIERRDWWIDTGPAMDLGEMEFASIVAAGGGRYVGVLKEIPNKMESVVLFSSPRTRTTLSIPISRLTVEAVREHLAKSDATFAQAGAK